MRKLLLLIFMALMATTAINANEVYFYFQDGEEDDFELMEPQTLVSIWNETDEEPVAVPTDMAFMSYQFEGAKILRITPDGFDYELVVEVEGDSDTYFLNHEDNAWYLTLLPEANELEIFVRVYLEGQAPGQSGSNVTMNFTVQAADGSDIQNPGECVSITYFDNKLFQTVTVPIEDNYGGASVAPGAAFEIVPAEGYIVSDVMTYLPGVAYISEPGDDDNIWRLSVSYEPESDFGSFFITVDKQSGGPSGNPNEATITQIAPRQWKVEWPAYTAISQTDTDYDDNNAYITDSKGVKTILYSDLHGEHSNPAIIFPEDYGNYFTLNLEKQNIADGSYTLTLPSGYVELGTSRLPSEEQNFDIEVGKAVEMSYDVQFSDVEGNYFDVSWTNVTTLTKGVTEGAYIRNVQTNEEYPMYYLVDDLYSKCNVRIYNGDKLRVGFTNNYPDLPDGLYEFYLPAGYVKFNGSSTSNEAVEGHLFSYTRPWSEGSIEFNALLPENKLVLTWVDAEKIEYDINYAGDGQGITGLTIFSGDYQINLDYPEDFTISGNSLTIDISQMPLATGECTLLVPEECIWVTVNGITDYTYGSSFRFNYGNTDNPDVPQLYSGEATWSHKTGDSAANGTLIEVSWDGYELSFVDKAELCSVHSPATGVLDLEYGTEVTLSEDKTKILINLANLPNNAYRVNIPEGCVYINVDGVIYLNTGTSMDGILGSVGTIEDTGHYKVVNIHGVTVLETDNAAELDRLPHGIYIINGKKVMR